MLCTVKQNPPMPYYRVLVSITPSITGEKDTYDMLSLFVDAHDVANVETAVQKCIDANYGYCEDAPITIAPARFDDMEQKPMAKTPINICLAGTCWLLDYKKGCAWDWPMVNWAASCPTFDSFRLFSMTPSKSPNVKSTGNLGRCWKVEE
jgi:hypothetical protein